MIKILFYFQVENWQKSHHLTILYKLLVLHIYYCNYSNCPQIQIILCVSRISQIETFYRTVLRMVLLLTPTAGLVFLTLIHSYTNLLARCTEFVEDHYTSGHSLVEK